MAWRSHKKGVALAALFNRPEYTAQTQHKALISCHSNQNTSQLHNTTNCTLSSMELGSSASLQASLLTP